jgi:hypothetical protein
MLYKNVKCYYQNGMPIWCGDWPPDRPMPDDVTETTCDAIMGPDGLLYHWANYADFRRGEYPAIGDQLDDLYKTLSYLSSNGTDIGPDGQAWIAQIAAIKDKYPKSS